MKKQVLLSVFAASLFAAPAALAVEPTGLDLGATRWSEESGVWADTDATATVAQIKDYNDKDLGTKSEQWTRGANKLKDGEKLVVDKGQATKADKPAGQKALPKTSAVK